MSGDGNAPTWAWPSVRCLAGLGLLGVGMALKRLKVQRSGEIWLWLNSMVDEVDKTKIWM